MSDIRQKLLATFTEQQAALTRFLRRRLGDKALAEDLTQETWIRAASTNRAMAIDNPRSYLFRIAGNLALDHQRHVGLGIEVEAGESVTDAVPDPSPTPESVVRYKREFTRFLGAVDRLPPRCREVFLLVKVHGLKYSEVAARLGISKNTVMVHVVNALNQLDAHFQPEFDRDPPA
jgi:RNA polymerase sigma-70 factor (ECF subfamily)